MKYKKRNDWNCPLKYVWNLFGSFRESYTEVSSVTALKETRLLILVSFDMYV